MEEQEVGHRAIPANDSPTLGNGRYRLATKLGEGGMASVYRAWDTQDKEWRAIKVLLPEFARRAKLRIRFANEAQTMLRLDHRHLVSVFDVGMDAELPYIVMEIADGGCVIDWVDRYGPMPARMAVDIMMQVCKGLGAAHAIGIVHRDVKPHNILITRRGVCRVTDFGIAQIDDAGGMTKTGSVMGTLGYMAPEQRTDAKNVDVRADVYGLGATLYKLVTGGAVADLFLAEHDAEMLEGVPPSLVPIVLKATAYKPAQRYSTVAELAKALHGAKRGLPAAPSDTPSLAMPPKVEGPTDLPKSELSEPTFLPADVPELPDLPDARASVARPKPVPSAPDEDDGDPPSNTPLPYFMPQVQQRKARGSEESDAVPDYIDQSALVEEKGGFVVELDDETKRLSEEARLLAIKEGRLDEHGNPIGGAEDGSPGGQLEGGLDGAENAGDLLKTIFKGFLGMAGKPLRLIAMMVVLGGLSVLLIMGGSAREVRAAQTHAHDSRAILYKTIESEDRIVEDLVAMGANSTHLSEMYFAFADAEEEPDRIDAALKFINTLNNAMPTTDAGEQASTKLHKLHMARGRLAKIDEAQKAYQEAMISWEEAADTPQGRAAIQFGAAQQP